MNTAGRGALTVIFGLLGVIAPMGAIRVATFMGKTDIAAFNSTMILVLSILLIVFLVIDSFSSFIDNKKRSFIIAVLFLFVSLISFMFNLVTFMNL